MFKKTKKIKGSTRGITFSDSELFPIHSKFKYHIDKANKRVVIVLSEENGQEVDAWRDKIDALGGSYAPLHEASVSRKASGAKYIPLVDIRNQEALQLFEGQEQLTVSIGDDVIVVACEEQLTLFEKARGFLQKKKNRRAYAFPKQDVLDAVGLSVAESPEDHIKIASFFSGCGALDQGLVEAGGFDIVFALEKNEEAARTYQYNHGDHIVVGDICDFDTSLMQEAQVLVGGPPCQGFSAANRRTNFLDNPNNSLVSAYIDAIKENPSCVAFILENVPQIITSFEGKFAKEICSALSDFDISYGVLSSADYGSAQNRKRAIFIGSKIGHIPLPAPTHRKEDYVTVRQAFEGLHDGIPNQTHYSKPKSDTLARMKCIKQGENWEAIPLHLRTERMIGNSHSSVYKRLEWDKPSITITNVRKSNILHPELNRVLSVREGARLFGLKDNYVFKGTLAAMQQQIANSVPTQIAKAIGLQIKNAFQRYACRTSYVY